MKRLHRNSTACARRGSPASGTELQELWPSLDLHLDPFRLGRLRTGPLANAREKFGDGFGHQGFDHLASQATAGKVHVRGSIDHAEPLAMRRISRQIAPG